MNTDTIITNQPITNIGPIPSKNKQKKYLVSSLIIVILSLLTSVYFYFQSKQLKKDIPDTTSPPTSTGTITSTPPHQIQTNAQTLEILDIKMDLPQNWKVISVSQNKAKILTDYPKYQVVLTLEVNKNTKDILDSYESKYSSTITEYGQVYEISCGGAFACTGAQVSNSKYVFYWDIESNQPVPTNLDQIWDPEHSVTQDQILNITKTIRPVISISSSTTDWKTYTHTVRDNPSVEPEFTFEFNYPSTWITEGRPDTDKTFWSIPGEIMSVMNLEIRSSEGKTVKDFIKRDQFPYKYIKDINNSSINGVIVSDPVTEGSGVTVAFFSIKDKMIILQITSDPPKIDQHPVVLLDQILSTLRIKEYTP